MRHVTSRDPEPRHTHQIVIYVCCVCVHVCDSMYAVDMIGKVEFNVVA